MTNINITPESIIPILTKADLISQAESLVRTESMGYAEAIIHICDTKGIDPEDISKLVGGSLKEKLKAEAQRNNLLPKPNSLFGL
jgi:precorrin-4 methylase